MRKEVMAKRRFRKHENSDGQLRSRASGSAANGNPRKPVLIAGARDMKVVLLGGEVRVSVLSTSGTCSDFNFLFVRAHASVLLVMTNQPGKVNEVPTHKEVLAKLRFNKHKNFGDQLPSQTSRCVGGTVDSNSQGLISAAVNAQGMPSTGGDVKPNLRKSLNSGSAVRQVDNAHLGRPLSPVDVHGRSGPSRIVPRTNEPRNPPHTDKAVHLDSQPSVSLAVELERMQVLGSELLRNDAQTSVDTVSPSANSPKKRPRKQKGAPADDVALARLRPRHSHNLGDIGGRDVIMSSHEEAYVGSSSSQIITGKVKARHQKLENRIQGK